MRKAVGPPMSPGASKVCYGSRPLRSPGLLRLLTSTTSALRSIAACCALHDQPAAAPARYYICASSARASLWPWRVAFAAGYSSEAVTAPTGPSLHTAPCARFALPSPLEKESLAAKSCSPFST